jgi:hypothetical protein
MAREDEISEESPEESGRKLVVIGANGLAGIAGAAAGAFLGPVGAIAGGAAAPALASMLSSAGRRIHRRLLGPNQEVRVGAALAVALGRIEERKEAGEKLREDGLFDPDSDPRGMLEGTLLAAARAYDEKKVPFLGAFYASFAYKEGVSITTAHQLLTILNRLTYHQLCALAYFADRSVDEQRMQLATEAAEGDARMSQTVAVAMADLASIGLLGERQADGTGLLTWTSMGTYGGGIPIRGDTINQFVPTPLGAILVEMAELMKIPSEDRKAVGIELGAKDLRSGEARATRR